VRCLPIAEVYFQFSLPSIARPDNAQAKENDSVVRFFSHLYKILSNTLQWDIFGGLKGEKKQQ